MASKAKLVQALQRSARSMVHGSLSELTRQCGDPACACARDPAYRHGPHLYLQFKADGKNRSVYVPAESAAAVKSAHAAWRRFQEVSTQISAVNRDRLLREIDREKQKRKLSRGKGQRQARGRSRARD